MDTVLALLSLVPFYLLGAFPTGLLIARQRHVDLTAQGSGNVGATNVARVLGKRAGLVTLLIDVLKGFLAAAIAAALYTTAGMAAFAAFAAVAGHCLSIPGKLRGGKGVATALGVFLLLSPLSALVGVVVFSAVFYRTRIVSLASISAALCAPIAALLLDRPGPTVGAMAACALMVVARHRRNIMRLIEGTEGRFSAARGKAASEPTAS